MSFEPRLRELLKHGTRHPGDGGPRSLTRERAGDGGPADVRVESDTMGSLEVRACRVLERGGLPSTRPGSFNAFNVLNWI